MFETPLRILTSCLLLLTATLPVAAEKPPAGPKNEDSRDTSKPPVREIRAFLNWSDVGWDEYRQKPLRNPLSIRFSGPAAPVSLIGKEAAPGTVKMSPEVVGRWTWADSQTLSFEPKGGWLAPDSYSFEFAQNVFPPDTHVAWFNPWSDRLSRPLTCSFGEQSFYIDPTTPTLQQVVVTVVFSHPVTVDEVTRFLSVVHLSETPLFVEGKKPQVIADEKNPLRFFLRSPLLKLGEKEDLVRFEMGAGIRAEVGGNPMSATVVTKVTVPSRLTGFFFKKAYAQVVNNSKDDPRQYVFLESNVGANGKEVAKVVEAWHLPEPPLDEKGRRIRWNKETVTDAVLAKCQRVKLQYVAGGGGNGGNGGNGGSCWG